MAETNLDKLKATLNAIAPCIIGLTFGRAGLIATSYGSYRYTDEGIFTEGPMLGCLFVLLFCFIYITRRKEHLSKRTVNRIARFCIVMEVSSIFVLGVLEITDAGTAELRFLFNTLCSLFASGAMYYWLRRMRGSRTSVAVLFVFGALILSEVELYLLYLTPFEVGFVLAGALALLQLPCMLWARGRTTPSTTEQLLQNHDYSGFGEETLKSNHALIAIAIGIGLMAIVTGFLRGYPTGNSITFTALTRPAYALLTIAISLAIIVCVLRGNRKIMSVGMFVMLALLACGALILYAALPDMLDIGAVLTTTLNALMVGFAWYIIVAFMSFGWRDPYYYAMAGWFVWLGARACTRLLFLLTPQLVGNSMLAITLTATLVVISTQVILILFLNIQEQDAFASHSQSEQAKKPRAIVRIMGLDEGKSLQEMRQDAMRRSAEIVGEQFLLSEREVDVLALYMMGLTQKKVAEELFITPSTAHAHIKHIYAKMDMHSRQEILDYIKTYAS